MIVVALPTIVERGSAWVDVSQAWYEVTSEPIVCVPAYRPGGWAQGLNEVWELHPDADIFVCGSDDMVPQKGWLEAIKPWIDKGVIAPQVHDPRFSRWGPEVRDGDETRMSNFPILPCQVLSSVFPILPNEPQHYYADDTISDKAREVGFPTLAVPSCVITHLMDERGRGAGMGAEDIRMAHDKALYVRYKKSVSNPRS